MLVLGKCSHIELRLEFCQAYLFNFFPWITNLTHYQCSLSSCPEPRPLLSTFSISRVTTPGGPGAKSGEPRPHVSTALAVSAWTAPCGRHVGLRFSSTALSKLVESEWRQLQMCARHNAAKVTSSSICPYRCLGCHCRDYAVTLMLNQGIPVKSLTLFIKGGSICKAVLSLASLLPSHSVQFQSVFSWIKPLLPSGLYLSLGDQRSWLQE